MLSATGDSYRDFHAGKVDFFKGLTKKEKKRMKALDLYKGYSHELRYEGGCKGKKQDTRKSKNEIQPFEAGHKKSEN